MSDLIYRLDAIKAVDIGNLHRGIVNTLQEILREDVPSAPRCVPESDILFNIRCYEEWIEKCNEAIQSDPAFRSNRTVELLTKMEVLEIVVADMKRLL